MAPGLLVGALLRMAAKGLLSEKLKIKIVLGLGNLLVGSTKNKLDDKIWEKVKLLLLSTK